MQCILISLKHICVICLLIQIRNSWYLCQSSILFDSLLISLVETSFRIKKNGCIIRAHLGSGLDRSVLYINRIWWLCLVPPQPQGLLVIWGTERPKVVCGCLIVFVIVREYLESCLLCFFCLHHWDRNRFTSNDWCVNRGRLLTRSPIKSSVYNMQFDMAIISRYEFKGEE